MLNNFCGSYIGHDPLWQCQSAYNRKSNIPFLFFPGSFTVVATRYRRKSNRIVCSFAFAFATHKALQVSNNDVKQTFPIQRSSVSFYCVNLVLSEPICTMNTIPHTTEDKLTVSPRSKKMINFVIVRMKSLLYDFLALGFVLFYSHTHAHAQISDSAKFVFRRQALECQGGSKRALTQKHTHWGHEATAHASKVF